MLPKENKVDLRPLHCMDGDWVRAGNLIIDSNVTTHEYNPGLSAMDKVHIQPSRARQRLSSNIEHKARVHMFRELTVQ